MNFRYWLCSLIFIFLSFSLQAQFYLQGYNPALANVEVCQGQTFTVVNNHDLVADIAYDFKYPANTNLVNRGNDLSPFTSQYDTDGVFSVSVVGNQSGTGTVGVRYTRNSYITVLPTPTPTFSVARCNNKEVFVTITENIYDKYVVDFGDGNFTNTTGGQTVSRTYASVGDYTITVTGFHILNNLASTECGNVSATANVSIVNRLEPNFSVTAEQANSYCEGQVNISFDVASDYRYVLEGSDVSGDNVATLANIPIGSTEPIFTLVQENANTLTKRRTYNLKVFDNCGNEILNQNRFIEVNVNGGGTYPIELQNVNVTVRPIAGTLVFWSKTGFDVEDLRNYEILREGQSLALVKDDTVFVDRVSTNPPTPTCYQIQYITSCGFQTISSAKICTIALTLEDKNSELDFSWTPYINGNQENVTYEVVKLNGSGGVENRIFVGDLLNFTLNDVDTTSQVLRYRIDATTTSGFISQSNEVTIKRVARLFFPTAFTPNGDQLNDTFFPKGLFIKDFTLNIFNKNGQKVFSSDKMSEGWDGRYQNQAQPADSYIYVANITDQAGESQKFTGTFLLIR